MTKKIITNHGMVERDILNSRVKDFFDCYHIFMTKEIVENELRNAIFATFRNRKLAHNPDLKLFTEDFAVNESMRNRWNTFLKKIGLADIEFSQVMSVIRQRLEPIVEDYWKSIDE